MKVRGIRAAVVALVVAAGIAGLSRPRAQGMAIAFVNVTAVPMDGRGVVPATTVVVDEGRVVAMGPSASVKPPMATTLLIDGRGKFLMPGLAEMHGHIPSPSSPIIDHVLFLYVANGVTVVRGMQGAAGQLAVRDRAARNEIVAPTLVLAGPALTGANAGTPDAAAATARKQSAEGWDLLKVLGGMNRDAYDAMVAAAREVRMPFAGHVPPAVGLEHVLLRSQDTIDHLDMYAESIGGERAPVTDQAIEDLVARTLKAGTWNVPTLYVWETLRGPVTLESRTSLPELRYMPRQTVAQWTKGLQNRLQGPAFDATAARHYIDNRMRILGALHRAGAGILLGSDAPQQFNVPGFSIHREMRRMIDAGMTPEDVLRAGTASVGAHVRGDFGRVAVGQRADFILLDANPLEDVGNVQKRAGVMLRGRWIPESEIAKRLEAIAASYQSTP
jgi:imidazolonepropionase-like amidohydrolase